MKLSIEQQRKLISDCKQRHNSLKENGFKLILKNIGILESNISNEIEITDEKQEELKAIFRGKYNNLDKNSSESELFECIGILEVLTFIGIDMNVCEEFAEADLLSRWSS